MDKNIPLHKEIVVSIKDTIPEILKDKRNIAIKKEDGSFRYKGKTWKNGGLHTKQENSEFSQSNFVNTIKPTISDYHFINNTKINYTGNISVKILDNESGISYYRGEIDGKWILMEYDFKSDLSLYII